MDTVLSWIMSGRYNYVAGLTSCQILFPVYLPTPNIRYAWKRERRWVGALCRLTNPYTLKHIAGYAMDGFTCVDSEEEARRIGEEKGEVQD
jgi:hypothetical protein